MVDFEEMKVSSFLIIIRYRTMFIVFDNRKKTDSTMFLISLHMTELHKPKVFFINQDT